MQASLVCSFGEQSEHLEVLFGESRGQGGTNTERGSLEDQDPKESVELQVTQEPSVFAGWDLRFGWKEARKGQIK